MRIPRTIGLTQLSKNYQQGQVTLREVHDYLLSRYINDGFRINGQLVDIHQLAHLYQLSPANIYKAITKHVKQMTGLTSDENISETYRATLATIIFNALGDRGRVLAQYDALAKAQGAKYVPFLTNSVNQTLKLLIDSNKPLLDLLKALQPNTPSISITNQQANIPLPNNDQAMGTNEAVKFIDAKSAEDLLNSGTLQQGLLQAHIDGQELPEIIATKQKGSTDLAEAQRAMGKKPESRKDDDSIISSPELE